MESAASILRSVLAQMTYFNDAALWQAARATMSVEQRECLQHLHDKQQREALTAEEKTEEQILLTPYRETLLIRAQAVVILKCVVIAFLIRSNLRLSTEFLVRTNTTSETCYRNGALSL